MSILSEAIIEIVDIQQLLFSSTTRMSCLRPDLLKQLIKKRKKEKKKGKKERKSVLFVYTWTILLSEAYVSTVSVPESDV